VDDPNKVFALQFDQDQQQVAVQPPRMPGFWPLILRGSTSTVRGAGVPDEIATNKTLLATLTRLLFGYGVGLRCVCIGLHGIFVVSGEGARASRWAE